MEKEKFSIVDLMDCLFQLKLANEVRIRSRYEYPPKTELDLFEKVTATMDEDITNLINQMKDICEGIKTASEDSFKNVETKKEEVDEDEDLDREEKLRNNRLIDMDFRLETIHRLRFIIIEKFSDIKETQMYIEANEILNEIERYAWYYIKKDKYPILSED